MFALLFFLPIYYRVVKRYSSSKTSLMLLSQTLMLALCGGMVYGLVERLRWRVRWLIVFGWLCTSCGFGLLSLMDIAKSTAADVLLNLLSGLGIGTLLSALALSAKTDADQGLARQTPAILIYMRYLGSACGVVVTGILFQRILQHKLHGLGFGDDARRLVKHATTLADTIGTMSGSSGRELLIQGVQDSLSIIWMILSISSAVVFLLVCIAALTRASRRQAGRRTAEVIPPDTAPIIPLDIAVKDEFVLEHVMESLGSSAASSPATGPVAYKHLDAKL